MGIFGRQTRSVVGLDIGSYSVKLVRLLHRNGKRHLLSAVEEPCVSESKEQDNARIQAVRKVFKRAGLKPGRGDVVVTAVSGSGTAIKQVEFPLLTDEELQSSIKWQAGKRLPFGAEEAVLDYQVVSQDETAKKMSVLLVAVTRNHLREHLELLKVTGVDPLIIDLSPLALANTVMGTQELEHDRAIAVVEIGASNTILDVFAPGEFFFTRDIAVTGQQLIEETGDRGRIPSQRPEDRLIFEIRRSLTYYENRRGRGGFEKLLLAGGGARQAQLSEHLHSRLGVPVEIFDPFKGIDTGDYQEHLVEAAPQLTQAVGLALRKVRKKHV
jgi:type IV pilus assembly protein PilM